MLAKLLLSQTTILLSFKTEMKYYITDSQSFLRPVLSQTNGKEAELSET